MICDDQYDIRENNELFPLWHYSALVGKMSQLWTGTGGWRKWDNHYRASCLRWFSRRAGSSVDLKAPSIFQHLVSDTFLSLSILPPSSSRPPEQWSISLWMEGWETSLLPYTKPCLHTVLLLSIPFPLFLMFQREEDRVYIFSRAALQKHHSTKEWLWFVAEKASQTDRFCLIFSGQRGKEHIFSSKSIQQICTAVS